MPRDEPPLKTAVQDAAERARIGNACDGRLERIVTTSEGQPTHIVVEDGGLDPDRREVPIGWVTEIDENVIMLDVPHDTFKAIALLEPDS